MGTLTIYPDAIFGNFEEGPSLCLLFFLFAISNNLQIYACSKIATDDLESIYIFPFSHHGFSAGSSCSLILGGEAFCEGKFEPESSMHPQQCWLGDVEEGDFHSLLIRSPDTFPLCFCIFLSCAAAAGRSNVISYT